MSKYPSDPHDPTSANYEGPPKIANGSVTSKSYGVWIVYMWSNNLAHFMGVFSEKGKAENACLDENYCVCPAVLNEVLSKDLTVWPDAYYPKHKTNHK